MHKLRFRAEIEVDLIPFGALERADRTIAWPPENALVMMVLGFREALLSSVTIRLPENAQVKVVPLQALAVLKFFAWANRRLTYPGKDAHDLLLILRNYLDAGNRERVYDENPDVEGSPYDYEAAGAWLLRKDMARLLDSAGREQLGRLLAEQADEQGNLRLVGDMMHDPDHALELLAALERGFIEGST